MGEAPSAVLAAFGSMWVQNHRGASISRIDPSTSRVVATIDAGADLVGLGAAKGFVFSLDWTNERVVRVSAKRNEIVSRTPVGTDGATFATLRGRVYLGSPTFSEAGQLIVLDPRSGRVVERHRYPGKGFFGVFEGAGRLWAAPSESALYEVDPRTGKLGPRIDLSYPGFDVTESEGSLWVTHARPVLTRVDLDTLATEEIVIDPTLAVGEPDIEAIPGGVAWRLGDERFAIVSNAGEVTIYEGLPAGEYAGGVGFGFGSLWLPNWTTNDVWRVPLPTG